MLMIYLVTETNIGTMMEIGQEYGDNKKGCCIFSTDFEFLNLLRCNSVDVTGEHSRFSNVLCTK